SLLKVTSTYFLNHSDRILTYSLTSETSEAGTPKPSKAILWNQLLNKKLMETEVFSDFQSPLLVSPNDSYVIIPKAQFLCDFWNLKTGERNHLPLGWHKEGSHLPCSFSSSGLFLGYQHSETTVHKM